LLYFVLTTGECNLNCRYCGGSFPESQVPWRVKYSIGQLKSFIENDPDSTIAFYGGEPLLNSKFVKDVMDEVRARRFVIQTNGLLKEDLEQDYWNRMDAVLLSIDGARETTDFYRGSGVYSKVIKAAETLRRDGFEGDLIARMAASEKTDICNDVLHLINCGLFDHVHWQLDVGWSVSWTDFDGWSERSYKPGILRLLRFWTSELEKRRVIGIVPFLGILKRLRGGGAIPPCGSGSESFAIMPDGRIRACPIAFDAEWAKVGDIFDSRSSDLPTREIIGECNDCKYLRVCGGRCLYMNREGLWGKDGFQKVCNLTKFTINAIASSNNIINRIVAEGVVDFDELNYPKFNNSTEIIP